MATENDLAAAIEVLEGVVYAYDDDSGIDYGYDPMEVAIDEVRGFLRRVRVSRRADT